MEKIKQTQGIYRNMVAIYDLRRNGARIEKTVKAHRRSVYALLIFDRHSKNWMK